MALVETRYAVPGWGVGGLWLDGNVVHAHDFDFEPGLRAAPREGARVPPNSTVAANPSRDGDGFVPRSHERRSGERESPTADS